MQISREGGILLHAYTRSIKYARRPIKGFEKNCAGVRIYGFSPADSTGSALGLQFTGLFFIQTPSLIPICDLLEFVLGSGL